MALSWLFFDHYDIVKYETRTYYSKFFTSFTAKFWQNVCGGYNGLIYYINIKQLRHMTTLQHLAEHNAFLKWFEKNYPHLSKMHCMDILPAVDETGFIIKWKKMDKAMFAIILQITNDYYCLLKC